HRHQVRRIAGSELRRELIVAGPGDDIDVDADVGVLGVELVHQRGHDAAFAVGPRRLVDRAVLRAAFAEKTLDRDRRDIALRRARQKRQNREQKERAPFHRTAAPDTARTMYFWKNT